MTATFVIAVVAAAAACAQNVDRTFFVPHADSAADLQSLVGGVHSLVEIQRATSDFAQKAITMSGTPVQLDLAEWLCHELDQPTGSQSPREYLVPDARPPIVRIYYLANVTTPQNLQDVVNAIRSTVDIQRIFFYGLRNAIVMRGTGEQMTAADWLLRELDRSVPGSTSQDFPMPGEAGQVAKIFSLKDVATPQALQEITNLTRSLADIQRFYPYSGGGAIIARGTPEQIALAGWLVQSLDQPSGDGPVSEYRVTGSVNPVVRIVFLSNIHTPQALQEIVSAVRAATQIQRAYPNNLRMALALRGTADQISRAEQLIMERDKP
jgi:hypothetical protein